MLRCLDDLMVMNKENEFRQCRNMKSEGVVPIVGGKAIMIDNDVEW